MSDLERANADQCLAETGALVIASGRMLLSAGAVAVAAPTVLGEIPALMSFIGNAMVLGATAALYANCKDEVAAKSKAK